MPLHFLPALAVDASIATAVSAMSFFMIEPFDPLNWEMCDSVIQTVICFREFQFVGAPRTSAIIIPRFVGQPRRAVAWAAENVEIEVAPPTLCVS